MVNRMGAITPDWPLDYLLFLRKCFDYYGFEKCLRNALIDAFNIRIKKKQG